MHFVESIVLVVMKYFIESNAKQNLSESNLFFFQLISPEDLLNAAVHMEELGLPVR